MSKVRRFAALGNTFGVGGGGLGVELVCCWGMGVVGWDGGLCCRICIRLARAIALFSAALVR